LISLPFIFDHAGGDVSANADLEFDWNKIIPGFCKLKPNRHLKFDVGSTLRKIVYISVNHANGRTITDNFSKKKRRNVIILPGGQLVDAKKRSVWVDFEGNNHKSLQESRSF